MASSLVLVHDALVDHAIDDRNSFFVGRHGSLFVAGVTRLDDILDLGAHQGALRHVVLAGLLGLAGALPGGFNVCHWFLPCQGPKEPRIIRARPPLVNDFGNSVTVDLFRAANLASTEEIGCTK